MKHGATKRAQKPNTAPIVVIGYGNPYRRDDGAGPALAEKLVDYWSTQDICARLLTSTQLVPEMADDIGDDTIEAVVFIDTTTQRSGNTIQISPLDLDVASPSLGHHVDPATLLLYVALLYGRYPRAWLVTIPGSDFNHGQGFSNEVSQWLSHVPMIATQLLAEMKDSVPCMNLQLPNV